MKFLPSFGGRHPWASGADLSRLRVAPCVRYRYSGRRSTPWLYFIYLRLALLSPQCTGKPLILGISARTHGFTARLHDYAISTPAPAGACPWPCTGCTSISSFDAEGSCNSLELAVTSRVPSPPRRLRHITAVTAPATATTEASIPLSAATRSSEDFGSATVANLTGGGGGGGGAKATPMP